MKDKIQKYKTEIIYVVILSIITIILISLKTYFALIPIYTIGILTYILIEAKFKINLKIAKDDSKIMKYSGIIITIIPILLLITLFIVLKKEEIILNINWITMIIISPFIMISLLGIGILIFNKYKK
jgi:hypothetical protein